MRHHTLSAAALLLVTTLTLGGCVSEDDTATSTDIEVTAPTGAPQPEFHQEQVDPVTSTEITGERVDDPKMELSYKWQGSSYGTGAGSIIVVAVTNKSDVPMPVDVLKPKLRYNTGNNKFVDANPISAEQAGVDILGVDRPLGPGATTNAKYAFDVTPDGLWDAEFTIGNVKFKGNLNN